MAAETKPVTLGVIVGNRGFFPKHLCVSGRETIIKVLAQEGIRAILVDADETPYGSLESIADSQKCADLFRRHRDEIDGVLVTLPNFGDERAIANTLRWAELNVPVLVQAFPDDPNLMAVSDRRDSFCGKMSCCNNLRQYGIKYSLTTRHTMDPESADFIRDLIDKGYINENWEGFVNPNPSAKLEIALRRQALDDIFDQLKKSKKGQHSTPRS